MPFILYSIWHYVGFLVERRTKIVAGKSCHSISFYNWNPCVKSLAGRSRHHVSIFNQNPRLTLRWRHFTSFFGQIFLFRAIEGDDGRATLGCKRPTKGRSTWAKREKHASISGGRLHSSGTLLPFFYGDEGITRAVVTKKWRSCRVCIQNEDVHIARNSYFKFNTPKLIISHWNESLVVPSFPLSSASSEKFPPR